MVKKEEKKQEKVEKKPTAKSPFILALIGGIFSVLFGLLISTLYFKVSELMTTSPQLFNMTAEEIVGIPQALHIIGLAALGIFALFGVLELISAFWLKKERTMKRGGIMALIVGILSLNIFVIIAGALGLAFRPKKK